MWEFYSRKTLDSTQRLTVEVMMAESGGRWAARTTGREMPRQNGKGDELEVVELWGIVQRAEAILHTAHELTTVSSAHQRMAALIEGHADLRRRKRKILNGIGQQLIELTNDGVIAYRTRTNGGGRGLDDISRLVIDEAQHAKPEQLASSTPILLANPNPQMNFAGTGGIKDVSDWWWSLRKRALDKDPGPFGYVGHTAEKPYIDNEGKIVQPPVDATDRGNWFDANPALHNGRGEEAFFEEQLRTLGPALFSREHCCVWDPPKDEENAGRVVTATQWQLAGDSTSSEFDIGPRVAAFDVNQDRTWSAIGWVGERGEVLHSEVVDSQYGTAWVIPRLVRWVQGAGSFCRGITYVSGTPAESLVPDLARALKEADVTLEPTKITAAQFTAGCGDWYDKTIGATLRHVRQDWLTRAVDSAEWVDSGKSRRLVADPPLMAVVAALQGFQTVPVPELVSPGYYGSGEED